MLFELRKDVWCEEKEGRVKYMNGWRESVRNLDEKKIVMKYENKGCVYIELGKKMRPIIGRIC